MVPIRAASLQGELRRQSAEKNAPGVKPGDKRQPVSGAVLLWIPAFAGMTKSRRTCHPGEGRGPAQISTCYNRAPDTGFRRRADTRCSFLRLREAQ